MANTIRYTMAFTVMLVGFLPISYTALFTSNYIPLADYIVATTGFILAVHITETRTSYNEDNNP